MNKFFLLLAICVSSFGFSQDDYENYGEEESTLNWLTDLNQAQDESIAQNKPILVYFTGSDWCGPCKSLKKDFFNTKVFEEKAEDLVLVKIDMPRRMDIITPEQKEKNKTVVNQYNTQGGYPNIVALNMHLNILGELSGYTFLRDPEGHFAFVDSILKQY